MMRRLFVPSFLFITVLTLFFGVVLAQQGALIEPLETNPADPVAISFPPAVYVVQDEVIVQGSARPTNFSGYRLEFRPLVIDLDETEEEEAARPWFPATLPNPIAVDNNELGRWQTRNIPDGLYELRLVVTLRDGSEQIARVSPLRVLNEADSGLVRVPPTLDGASRPPLPATPTPLPGFADRPIPPTAASNTDAPRVIALIDANVRTGDDTIYDRVGFLLQGEAASVLGISSFGTGWYYVELPEGLRGFIAPSTVRAEGNLRNLPQINPPPPPTPRATATPLATATPITNANLVVTGRRTEPVQPICGQRFEVRANIVNTGTTPTASGATVFVANRHIRTNQITNTNSNTIPVLQPGQNWVVVIPLTITVYVDEDHLLEITIDPDNQLPETNKQDNFSTLQYRLAPGC